MSFPLGKPILLLAVIAVATGFGIGFRSAPPRTDLVLWVFADTHARMYRGNYSGDGSLLDQFRKQTGHSVRADLIAGQALDLRLISLSMASGGGAGAPDLAEVEIGSIGKFFRGPADDVVFLPLNKHLDESGWRSRIVASRFAPWSKGAAIFGIPHDLHPCTITYRKDLFDQAGVNLESAMTWDEFQSRCLEFQQYWQGQGIARTAIGLSSSASDSLVILLQQQHLNLIDPDLSVHLADEKVLHTLMWYTQAVAGVKRIGGDFNPAPGQNVRDLAHGDICAMITPDWQLGDIHEYGSDMIGKLHMIPLPRFSSNDAPTASWGGTMIGILRSCKNPDLAWKLIEKLYLDRDALKVRQQVTNILPPIPEYWSDPVYQQPDPMFAGQKIDQLYLSLASQLPKRYVTAYSATAQTLLAVVLNRAVYHVQHHGNAGLESACRQWLSDGAENLRGNIAFDRTAE